jgi:hypothetical protein
MKLFRISLLLLCISFFVGCIGEREAYCPESSLILEFVYTDQNQKDIFHDRINQVDVFVFDSSTERLVIRRTVSEAELLTFQGAELPLPAGEYRVICWANAHNERHTFSNAEPGSHINDIRLGHTLSSGSYQGASSLYYAPQKLLNETAKVFKVAVPKFGSYTASIPFSRAHIKIEVYVKGFEDGNANETQRNFPMVEVAGVSPYYDFSKTTLGDPISYRSATTPKVVTKTQIEAGETVAFADFYTPLFREDTPQEVYIRRPSDNSIVTTVNLMQFIANPDNSITILDTNMPDMTIPIYIEYGDDKNVAVTVTVPKFQVKPSIPEL